ncbi:hypothetical protein BH09SUM1_BH09SUM1_24520 [soil metagenome]
MSTTKRKRRAGSCAASNKSIRINLLALMALVFTAPRAIAGELPELMAARNAAVETIGSGDGGIHIVPSLHPYSIKNGGKLTISAVVKSAMPIRSVTTNLGGLATVELKPNAQLGMGALPGDGNAAVYEAEWIGNGLQEKVYAATITVTDVMGKSYTDHSLTFSDPAAGNSTPGTTGYPNWGMQRVGALTTSGGEHRFYCAVIDAAKGYAYFATHTNPGQVVKVALGNGSAAPTRVGAVTLNSGEDEPEAAVIDAASGYAYFGTKTRPGQVVKIALGDGAAAPTRVGAVTFNSGEDYLDFAAVIDAAAGYAYFGTSTYPPLVVKVALGSGAAAPTRVGVATLDDDDGGLISAVIDARAGFAYFGTLADPGRVVKVALGAGAAAPTRVGAVTLDSGEEALCSAVIDAAGEYGYFGTRTFPGRVVKVALGIGAAPPTRVRAITFNTGENYPASAVIDAADGYAYFGNVTLPGVVVKVALGSGGAAPTRVGAITLNSGEEILYSGVIDAASGYAYFGTFTETGYIVKVSLAENDSLKGTKFTRVDNGTLTDVRFYSHAASGNLRLSIYDDNEPKNLLWESASIPNTGAGAEVVAPISHGSPPSVTLSPGTYWAAWQVDTNADVPSYTLDSSGIGFTFPQSFGPSAPSLPAASISSTTEKWTEYVTYKVTSGTSGWMLVD